MPTSRPFSYNPSSLNFSGTYNIGTMCVGVGSNPYINNYGGLTWWNGPDEDLGYCIGTVVPAQNQSTPLGNIGNVKFWRTQSFTDAAFLILVQEVTGQTFTDTPSACAYLASNNYWTSFDNVTVSYFIVSNRTSRSVFREYPSGNRVVSFYRPDTTPSYRLFSKPSPFFNGSWTEIANDFVGSPAKYTTAGGPPVFRPSLQYTYGNQGVGSKKGFWLTEVWVYQSGADVGYAFPFGGTATYGTTAYQNIVSPWI